MTVTKLFELFLLRKITILILLILVNITAFFTYDLVSMNHQLPLKMSFPISVDGSSIVDSTYIFNKYSVGSVMSKVVKKTKKTNYKFDAISDNKFISDIKYFSLLFTCDIKENCITASKLTLDAFNNEAREMIESDKILSQVKVSRFKDRINKLQNRKNTLITNQGDYFQLREQNVNNANNLDTVSSMLLLKDINRGKFETAITLTNIGNELYGEEKELEYYSMLKKEKHLFKWVVEPSIDNIDQKVSLSLWLILSFLMSIALYFLSVVLINTKQT